MYLYPPVEREKRLKPYCLLHSAYTTEALTLGIWWRLPMRGRGFGPDFILRPEGVIVCKELPGGSGVVFIKPRQYMQTITPAQVKSAISEMPSSRLNQWAMNVGELVREFNIKNWILNIHPWVHTFYLRREIWNGAGDNLSTRRSIPGLNY